MAEHSILILPQPRIERKASLGGRGRKVTRPSPGEQLERIQKRFQNIIRGFQQVQSSVEGIEIEQVVVFEVLATAVERLAQACAKIPGLEWLVDIEVDSVAPVAGFDYADEKEDRTLPCRLYAVMSTQKGLQELISLWKQWVSDPPKRVKKDYGPFRDVFKNLKDLRLWGVSDRLAETHAVENWKEQLHWAAQTIRFEVELFWRNKNLARTAAFHRLQRLVSDAGGRTLDEAQIAAIRYHGVLAELSSGVIRETVEAISRNTDTELLRCSDVMFFRPAAQSRFRHRDADQRPPKPTKGTLPLPSGDPVVALLDGLPLENHRDLAGRLVIDDPDDFASTYDSPQHQMHGTEMASLIIHGDLNTDSTPLPRPVYSRPILQPRVDFGGNSHEYVPDDRLLVDLIHRAVRRIVSGDNEEEPAASSVRIINLSIGNEWQPFDRSISPLAKLLDWLASEYNILFLVSAGNQRQEIVLPVASDVLSNLSSAELSAISLQALASDRVYRRLFSPADSINALTVGAVHADGSGDYDPDSRFVDLLSGKRLPSLLGTVSRGFNRSVKPDILFPGGRQMCLLPTVPENDKSRLSLYSGQKAPGILVAGPGTGPMQLTSRYFSCGTSNSNALASRGAALIYERVLLLRDEPGGDSLTDEFVAVILKSLLVHGASWGNAAQRLADVFKAIVGAATSNNNQKSDALRRLKASFLGYGEVDLDRSMFSTDTRVAMLGWGALLPEQGHLFSIPLPKSLSAVRVRRRLVVTLSWLSPIDPRHPNYRRAQLWFAPPQSPMSFKPIELDAKNSRRGTVQHQIYESEIPRALVDEDTIGIKVSCREAAEKFADPVPYALSVTLEVTQNLPIYEEIREALRARVRAQAARET